VTDLPHLPAPDALRDYPPLPRDFYDRKTKQVARDLIGAYLCRRTAGGVSVFRVTETEAYVGPHDLACHAAKGITPRTRILYGPPGMAYVYLIYGMHFCLNAVTEHEGFGAAVLIRAIAPLSGTSVPMNGPGKLTRALAIDKSLNGADLTTGDVLWFSAREKRPRIIAGPRIGVAYAGEWALAPLRFLDADYWPKTRARSSDVGKS
jgi:DNA-3-methyladenine glycosylase